ncbi:MAG: bifunctional hydroxymethylpyrimidine kinase/phosphomethylpyrimidine kinase [Oscillospiraceae bacterium]|jgi:pyridoxine kinase|nr:bifunctional hydroxymethylpyrimidine kinase/phosphomethylpyrimidine kinase [Oscillospiraceae bacterium]
MRQKRVAVINDICGLGRCSLAAALPVLSVLGVQPCPVPTAVLTNQTGYESYALLDCEPLLRRFPAEWRKRGLRLDAISTGFFASVGQVEAARALLESFRCAAGGDCFLLVDPVLGDHGKLYSVVNPPLLAAVTALAALADVLTPNVTEACLLTGESWAVFETASEAEQLLVLERMGSKLLAGNANLVTITGWRRGDEVCTLLFLAGDNEPSAAVYASPAVAGSYSGTGDLFAAALCGLLLQGAPPKEALRRITRFLEAALRAAAEEGAPGADGIPFEPCLGLLLDF